MHSGVPDFEGLAGALERALAGEDIPALRTIMQFSTRLPSLNRRLWQAIPDLYALADEQHVATSTRAIAPIMTDINASIEHAVLKEENSA